MINCLIQLYKDRLPCIEKVQNTILTVGWPKTRELWFCDDGKPKPPPVVGWMRLLIRVSDDMVGEGRRQQSRKWSAYHYYSARSRGNRRIQEWVRGCRRDWKLLKTRHLVSSWIDDQQHQIWRNKKSAMVINLLSTDSNYQLSVSYSQCLLSEGHDNVKLKWNVYRWPWSWMWRLAKGSVRTR